MGILPMGFLIVGIMAGDGHATRACSSVELMGHTGRVPPIKNEKNRNHSSGGEGILFGGSDVLGAGA